MTPVLAVFGAGGQAAQQNQYPQGQYQQNPYGAQYSSEPQQYQGGYPQGYGHPEYQNQPGYDQQYAQQPGYSPVIEGERLTMNDVIMKTGLSLAVVVLGAAVGWYMPILLVVGLIGGLVLGLVNGFKRKVSPVLVLAYALAEGLAPWRSFRPAQCAVPGYRSSGCDCHRRGVWHASGAVCKRQDSGHP